MNCLRDLSPRQREIALLVAAGLTDKQIAAQLGISDRAVRKHIARVTRRWGLNPQSNVRVLIAQRVKAA